MDVLEYKEFEYKGWKCWFECLQWYAQKNGDYKSEIRANSLEEIIRMINAGI